ncbi:sigma-54-dependent Fis family transcriptional regulator [Salmonella enterica]|uniref:Sigma-54-dependent Fis family transcriptional regulator n=1 Tax=Salmonella enterica TaxID=28901 RepID=A0A5U2F9R9_SALER|nr:sigma-54-dependent Fis family transcriptional regulator [Salmonella enterica]HAK1938868.1 sigma-54-dependent Fis family transcriptional regulator [Salmonella enterica]
MTKFDEVNFTPPKGSLLKVAVKTVLQQLTQQTDKVSMLRCFIPLPPPFSPVQFIELHFIDSGFYYRCFDDGVVESSRERWQGDISDVSSHMILSGGALTTELRFVRTDSGKFAPQDASLFAWLTRLVTPMLENFLEKERLHTTISSLAKERDHNRILVDITNSVLSHLDMEELIIDVAKEIHHYFGFGAISMVLRDPRKPGKFSSWMTDFTGQTPVRQQIQLSEESAILQKALRDTPPVLFHLHDNPGLWRNDPILSSKADIGLNTAFILPLTFGNHTPGVLLLAHSTPEIFDNENRQLLKHIADRIAIAVDNADAWRCMTELKESLKQENSKLNEQLLSSQGIGDIIYRSQLMQDLLLQVDIVAKSDSMVLICGETGTGKEIIARTIHQLSLRKDKPLVKINCAAIPASLLESELFGYDKGAFTGASNTHRGRFELADGGTLFLDEIGDLPLELQPKLLRVLQEREIERLGGNRTIPVNVRVIAATNRDLMQMVEAREFRSDLFYRLNVFPLELPPLRDRPEDIPLLAKYFTQKMAQRMNRAIDTIPTEALSQLMSYDWPGNVRELENVIERAVLLTRGTSLNLHLNSGPTNLLPALCKKTTPAGRVTQMLNPGPPETDEEERSRIIQVLQETNGIVAGPRGAAQRLGMKRTTLLSRMQRLGISAREIR